MPSPKKKITLKKSVTKKAAAKRPASGVTKKKAPTSAEYAAAAKGAKTAKPAKSAKRVGGDVDVSDGGASSAVAAGAGAGSGGRAGSRKADLAVQQERALKFVIEAARLLADDKCRDVVVLDVRGRSQVTDFTIVATGTSDRQMKAAGEHVDKMSSKMGMQLYRHNLKEANPTWVILDFVDAVIHLFEPDSRLYYDIEMLWGDAPRVAWERPADLKAKRDAEKADEAEATPASRNRAGLRRGEVL
jgi:ribosome-associated protein